MPNGAGHPAGAFDDSLAATWRADLGAGLVVFLVALPLCLGVALASGAPLLAGVVTGVVGGLLVSRLSGSALMVSGPAAGLTAIVLAAIGELGSFPTFLLAVVLAGAMQLAFGALRGGVVGHYVPSSVIRGMLAAIGLILIVKQLPYALGAGIAPAAAAAAELAADGAPPPVQGGMLAPVIAAARQFHPGALLLAVTALVLLAVWPTRVPARLRTLMPAPLVVVALGVFGALGLNALGGPWALPSAALVSLPTPESPVALLGFLSFPAWSAIAEPTVWRVAATIAIVASLETLLSLEATDRLDPWKRTAPANRELLAQGAGNVVAGLLGGLPMTGVIVRSAANVGAGGRTWRSSWLHGALLLAAVVALPTLLNRIPLAVLAAILLFTGAKLAGPAVFRDAWRAGTKYRVPFLVTVAAILATDLLVGIGIGLAAAALFILHDSWANAFTRHLEDAAHHRVRLELAEEVTFLNKARIRHTLDAIPAGSDVTVDATRTRHLDHDVVELLHQFRDTARRRGIGLRLVAVPEPALAGGH